MQLLQPKISKEWTSLVYDYYQACPTWMDRFEKINSAASKNKTQELSESFPDLNPHIQNVIMVDGLKEIGNELELCTMQLEDLRLTILSHLMATLPCIAVGTLRHGIEGWKDSASLVQSKIPVLYIDIRQENRKFWLCKINELEKGKNPSVKKYKSAKKVSYAEQSVSPIKDLLVDEKKPAQNSDDESDKLSGGQEAFAKKLVEDALNHCRSVVWQGLQQNEQHRFDILDVCRTAFLHSIYKLATKICTASSGLDSQLCRGNYQPRSIHQAIEQEKKRKQLNQDQNAQVHSRSISNMNTKIILTFFAFLPAIYDSCQENCVPDNRPSISLILDVPPRREKRINETQNLL